VIQSTPKITSLAGSLRSKHRTEPMPLVSHNFKADIDATFMKQTYNIAKEKQETDTQHQSQTDELATRFEMTKWIRFGHLQTPQGRPDGLKLVCSSIHTRPGSSTTQSINTSLFQTTPFRWFSEVVRVRDLPKPHKKAWGSNLSTARVLNDHIGVGARAVFGQGFPFRPILCLRRRGVLELLGNLQACLAIPPGFLFHVCLANIMNFF